MGIILNLLQFVYLTKLDSLRYNMNSSYVSWFLVLYFIVTYPMVFDIRIRSVPWVRRFFASSVCAFTTPGGRISQVPTCTRQYYTILCLLLYAIPRRLIVVYWPHTLTHPLASLSSVTTYFISSNLSIVVYYIAIHPSSILPPTCISNQTETYSFFESTTKAYPLLIYHWFVDCWFDIVILASWLLLSHTFVAPYKPIFHTHRELFIANIW